MAKRRGKIVIDAPFKFETADDLSALKNELKTGTEGKVNRKSFDELFTSFFRQFNPTEGDGDPFYHVIEDPDGD